LCPSSPQQKQHRMMMIKQDSSDGGHTSPSPFVSFSLFHCKPFVNPLTMESARRSVLLPNPPPLVAVLSPIRPSTPAGVGEYLAWGSCSSVPRFLLPWRIRVPRAHGGAACLLPLPEVARETLVDRLPFPRAPAPPSRRETILMLCPLGLCCTGVERSWIYGGGPPVFRNPVNAKIV